MAPEVQRARQGQLNRAATLDSLIFSCCRMPSLLVVPDLQLQQRPKGLGENRGHGEHAFTSACLTRLLVCRRSKSRAAAKTKFVSSGRAVSSVNDVLCVVSAGLRAAEQR